MATTTAKPRRVPRPKSKPTAEVHVKEGTEGPLDAYIPDASYATKYVSRLINGVKDWDLYAKAQATQQNVLIYGPTGPGKTTSVRAYAAHHRMPFLAISGHAGKSSDQVNGKYHSDGNGGWVWRDGPLPMFAKYNGPAVVLFNEVNFNQPKFLSSIFDFLADRFLTLDDHYGEVIVAQPQLLIVADFNPDYIGTMELNAAFKNRFPIQIHWDYDPTVEKQLVKQQVLLDFASDVRSRTKAGDFLTPLSTNMLIQFEQHVEMFGLDFAIQNLIQRYHPDEQAPLFNVIDVMRSNFVAAYTPELAPKPKPERKSTSRRKTAEEVWQDNDFTFTWEV